MTQRLSAMCRAKSAVAQMQALCIAMGTSTASAAGAPPAPPPVTWRVKEAHRVEVRRRHRIIATWKLH
jgi:hypothetical protein